MQVYAVDASEEAAAWARLNVQRNSLEARLQVSAFCMSCNGTLFQNVCLKLTSEQVRHCIILHLHTFFS